MLWIYRKIVGAAKIVILLVATVLIPNFKKIKQKKLSNLWVQADPRRLGWVGPLWLIVLGWDFFNPPVLG